MGEFLPIYVINPNSSVEVTDRIAWAARQAWTGDDPEIACVTLEEGPPGIITAQHILDVTPMVSAFVQDRSPRASAFVIACFSDPGMLAARAVTTKPVIGIGEAGLTEARAIGRIGIVAISSNAKQRHYDYYRQLGFEGDICGERAIDLTPLQSGDEALAFGRIVGAAKARRDKDDADAIVLGCAGMSQLRAKVEEAVGIPVIDPCGAAVRQAVARVTAPDAHRAAS